MGNILFFESLFHSRGEFSPLSSHIHFVVTRKVRENPHSLNCMPRRWEFVPNRPCIGQTRTVLLAAVKRPRVHSGSGSLHSRTKPRSLFITFPVFCTNQVKLGCFYWLCIMICTWTPPGPTSFMDLNYMIYKIWFMPNFMVIGMASSKHLKCSLVVLWLPEDTAGLSGLDSVRRFQACGISQASLLCIGAAGSNRYIKSPQRIRRWWLDIIYACLACKRIPHQNSLCFEFSRWYVWRMGSWLPRTGV